jgi:hypothetical protein
MWSQQRKKFEKSKEPSFARRVKKKEIFSNRMIERLSRLDRVQVKGLGTTCTHGVQYLSWVVSVE